MRHLDSWNAQRRAAADAIRRAAVGDAWRDRAVRAASEQGGLPPVCHQARGPRRAGGALEIAGRRQPACTIRCPLHLQKCYREWGYAAGSLPVTERVAARFCRCRCSRGWLGNSSASRRRYQVVCRRSRSSLRAGHPGSDDISGRDRRGYEGICRQSPDARGERLPSGHSRPQRSVHARCRRAAGDCDRAAGPRRTSAASWLTACPCTVFPGLTVFEKLPQEKRTPLAASSTESESWSGISRSTAISRPRVSSSASMSPSEKGSTSSMRTIRRTRCLSSAAFHKLLGRKFVFDHHDLSPELYRSRYKTAERVRTRGLAFCERRRSNWRTWSSRPTKATARSTSSEMASHPGRVFIVRNGPDLTRVRLMRTGCAHCAARARVILGYLGAMNPQDGVDYLLRALDHLRHESETIGLPLRSHRRRRFARGVEASRQGTATRRLCHVHRFHPG